MQTPTFLVLGWIFIAIGNSAPDLDTDPFGNVALEPLIFPDEQETDSSGQTTDLDLGLFSDDNDQRDQTSEPESSFFLANDIDCDASNADSLQFFGKMRRSKACQSPPTGGVSALKADLTNKDDLIGFNKFINQEQPRGGLQESSEECPQEVFETSTIPVCTQKFTRLETQPRTVAGILFDVIPGASAHDWLWIMNLLAKG